MTQTTAHNFADYSPTALRDHIEQLASVVSDLDPDTDAELHTTLTTELDAAVAAFKTQSPYGTDTATPTPTATTDGGQTVADLVDAELGDADHFLRHVTDDETTFSGRHDRELATAVEGDHIVHHLVEAYADDAHGDSLAWSRGLRRNECEYCEGDLQTTEERADGVVVETTACPDCPFRVERHSVDAPVTDAAYMKPIRFETTVPHEFDDEADVDWTNIRSDCDDKSDVEDVANVVRALSIRSTLQAARDKAYDSDEGIQTVECGHCDTVVDKPAAASHEHYGAVCPDCEDVEVWSPDNADLPDDVETQMDVHKTFTAERLVALLRDVLYYANYKRTNLDDEQSERVSDGITTGRGGKRDAHGHGRGVKGTGLRRPNGAFHGFAHWRTVLQDAKDTDLVERVDGGDFDDDHKDARWEATEKGRDVFNALARCPTCGERKQPYKRIHTYQTYGKYSNKDTRLTLACADCDQMSHSPSGMTISSSTGQYGHKQLDGVTYDG